MDVQPTPFRLDFRCSHIKIHIVCHFRLNFKLYKSHSASDTQITIAFRCDHCGSSSKFDLLVSALSRIDKYLDDDKSYIGFILLLHFNCNLPLALIFNYMIIIFAF